MLATSELQRKGTRVLRILTFFVHVSIIALAAMMFLKVNETGHYSTKIDEVRKSITSKREASQVREVEQEWEGYYFRLAMIREVISKQTNLGLILRELGLYLPAEDKIATLDLNINNNLTTEILARSIPRDADIFQYESILRAAFERSRFIGRDISTLARTQVMIRNANVDTIKVQMRADTRRS